MSRRLGGALAVLVSLALLALPACKGGWLSGSSPSTTAPGGPTAAGPPDATAGTGLQAPTAASTTALGPVSLRPGGPPPWAGPRISSGVARQVGLEEWGQAMNRGGARLLLPADTFLTPSQVVRRAGSPGGWGLVWDDIGTGKPGVLPSGEPCPACGRAVVGIAATAAASDKDAVLRSPVKVEWNDGSAVGYSRDAGGARPFKAMLFVSGQDRAYELWTHVSPEHLVNLIAQLRYVQGAP